MQGAKDGPHAPQPVHPQPASDSRAWGFALFTAFLSTLGVSIISPVVPFLVQPYLRDPKSLALVIGLLTSSYAVCQFLAAPALGAWSDAYGRRIVLLVCLIGSVLGYLLFGIGGALWVLFLGRMIDGLTGGNISILFAYAADITPASRRGEYFGRLGAATGIGFICGPLIGGLAARFGYSTPLFVGAALSFANAVWGYFFMPESLPAHDRTAVSLAQLNPLSQIGGMLTLPQVRLLLLVVFLHSLPFAVLASNFALLAKDALNWQPAMIGAILFAFGLEDTVTQGVLLQWLLPLLGEARVAIAALVSELLGYTLIAVSAWLAWGWLLVAGCVLFGVGESSFGPSVGGLISQRVGPGEQGRVQGSSQSLEAVARMVGPLAGGQLYTSLGRSSPYFTSALLAMVAIAALSRDRVKVEFGGSQAGG